MYVFNRHLYSYYNQIIIVCMNVKHFIGRGHQKLIIAPGAVIDRHGTDC